MKNAKKQKPGPKEDHLKLDGNWKDAVKEALGKKPPKEGWPEEEKGRKEGN